MLRIGHEQAKQRIALHERMVVQLRYNIQGGAELFMLTQGHGLA